MSTFWLTNPSILLDKNELTEIWPDQSLSLERKLNAITRLIVVLSFLGYFLTKSKNILITLGITLVILVVVYKTQKKKLFENFVENNAKKEIITKIIKEKCQTPTQNNPLMNVLPTDYTDNPKRKPAAPSYNENIEQEINEAVKSNLDPKLFRNLGDNLTFQHSMRTFNAQPATTIPNDQKSFREFLYGNMKSCKEGDEMQCTKNNTDNLKLR
jgi:hypothetical protein